VETTHDLDVEGLQRVASGLNEVDTCMYAVIHNVDAVNLIFSIEVRVIALLNILDDWAPGNVVVYEIAEAWGVNDGKAETNAILLNVGADGLYGNRLGANVEAWRLTLLRRVERGIEKSVDEGRFTQARLACTRIVSSSWLHQSIGGDYLPTTMTLKLNPFRTLLRCHWLGRLAKPT
jgi:hypothetical protein